MLAFVPRRQLGNVASEVGRHFAHIIQHFIHDEVRAITLANKMSIIAPRWCVPSDQPMVIVGEECDAVMNIPDWPMPGNIKNFKEIGIKYPYY
jgi:hypothetical protein